MPLDAFLLRTDLMVWCATIFGNVVGIPESVMGLTILAAGTSVPDLMTSVIVAKQGAQAACVLTKNVRQFAVACW